MIKGLGEFGFDYTKGGTLIQQERFVARLVELAEPSVPIILHVRGKRNDLAGEEAFSHCLEFLRSRVRTEQKIQLHSFSGSARQVTNWLAVFPNTHFSYSGMSSHFNSVQVDGVRSVPIDRLLFETDSPYLPPRREVGQNAPGYVGEVIARIADMRQQEVGELVRRGWENSVRMFRL